MLRHMPLNPFAALGEPRYGPQFVHNLAFLSPSKPFAVIAEAWLQTLRADRRLGSVAVADAAKFDVEAAVQAAGAEMPDTEPTDIEDLDATDFDIAVLIDEAPDSLELGPDEATWLQRKICLKWQQEDPDNLDRVCDSLRCKVVKLLEMLDEETMQSICRPGLSC
mmetsp:Transcript_121349/g.241730  ORF Transcript_121349/g.241730 Transcript_121349/m.241730 type:complete len:165 (+) Transcript_121349:43-537(+)